MPDQSAVIVPTLVPAVIDTDATQFKSKSLKVLDTAKALVIESDEQLAEVAEWVRGIKNERKSLDELCDPGIEAAHMEHKARLNIKKQYAVPLDEAERVAKEKMGAFNTKRAAEREAERKRLDAEAAEKARVEREAREKAEAEAKALREKQEAEERAAREKIEAEAKAKRDAQRAEQEAAAKALEAINKAAADKLREEQAKKDADAATKAAAEKLEREKQEAAAKAKREKDEAAARAEREAEAEKKRLADAKAAKKAQDEAKPAGTSFSKDHYAAVDNDAMKMELVKAVAAGAVPLAALEPAQKWLNDYAHDTEGALTMPGVRFYSKDRVKVNR